MYAVTRISYEMMEQHAKKVKVHGKYVLMGNNNTSQADDK